MAQGQNTRADLQSLGSLGGLRIDMILTPTQEFYF